MPLCIVIIQTEASQENPYFIVMSQPDTVI